MIHRILIPLVCFSAASTAADLSAWRFTQPVTVTKTGLTRIDLPPSTLDVARPGLEDIRVISPSSIETPFVIQWPAAQRVRLESPASFEMRLVGSTTELRMRTASTEPVWSIRLRPAGNRFLKAARVESSGDGTAWNTLVANTVIFREGSAESITIKLPGQSLRHLRVIIDDQSSPPVAFTGAQLELGATTPEELPLTTTVKKREQLEGKTRLTLDLGGKNAFVAALRFTSPEALFSRRVSVVMPGDGGPDIKSTGISSAALYRLSVGGLTSAGLEVPIHRSVRSNQLVIDIDDGDSPPLKIEKIEATHHPVGVLFHAGEPGEWRLLSGNELAGAPRYDLAAVENQITKAAANRVQPEMLTTNRSYEKPAALPGVNVQGVDAALADCRFRRPVTIPAPGVISITLDPAVLAHAEVSLRDLRLVQEGRQIPFLLDYERGVWRSFVEPGVALTKDDKRPRTSIWTLTLPFDQLPASRITCISRTSLFDRQVTAWTMQRDSFGNESRMRIGEAKWIHKPGDVSDQLELILTLDRLPKTFTLETDNGDNPPIEIERVRVHYPKVTMLAKVTDTSGLYLYYGNDHVIAPTYDLRLVKAELESAPHEAGTLGAEEKLKAGPPARTSSSGSPWLWAAMAAVVATLLWVVARMLPKPENGAA